MKLTPFLRLLIPIISGILFHKFISPSANLFFVGIGALVLMFISFFIIKRAPYSLQWLFGGGVVLFLFSLSVQYCQYREQLVSYDFPQNASSYIAEVVDFPQQKKRSFACEVNLTYPTDKKIMLYLEPDSNSQQLQPGDKILLHAFVQPFKNLGNPGEFDYETYMHNKGFTGSAFVKSNDWISTGVSNRSIKTEALRVRAKLLQIYKTYDLADDEQSFLSAITLGYKADLSDELKTAFNATGTSHILAVSGLHVGIVYIVIMFFFSFMGNRGASFFLKQIFILICLWGYVFITGMPVSVIRAAIMLSLLCIGKLFNRKGFSYNTLAIAAFFSLIINPFYLFNVGFQLSFACVFAILFFQPKIVKLYTPKHKLSNYFWNLLTVSLAAQLGAFPIVLFYFGTFPTYFFITNLLILPFIGGIIYFAVSLTLVSLLAFLNLDFLQLVSKVIIIVMQFLIKTVLKVVYFFESLPMSVFDGFYISTLQLFLIFAGLFLLTVYLMDKRANLLISFLVSVSLLLLTSTLQYLKPPHHQFIVFNNYNEPDMGYTVRSEKVALQTFCNQTIGHPTANIVLLTENNYTSKVSNQILTVDYLILASDNSFSMLELIDIFHPKEVIIDSSIARYAANKLKNECEKLKLPFHDVSESGAFSINF